MTDLIITSPRPNQLVSGAGEVTWVDLDGFESYYIEIELDGFKQHFTVPGQARKIEVRWDEMPWCNSAKVRVKRSLGDPGAEASPIIIPRHLPPVPVMVSPSSGNEAWSEVVVSWVPTTDHDIDHLPFGAKVQAKQSGDWMDVVECRPSDDMAIVDCRRFDDGPLVLRVSFSNEAGSTFSSEATINVNRQGGLYVDVNPPMVDVSNIVSGGKITFSLSGKDEGSGIPMLRIRHDDDEWGAWLPFSPKFEVNASEDGVSRFFFQFVDNAGNMAESSTRMFCKVYHNAITCSKVGNDVIAACDSLVVSPGRSVISMPGKVTCLGSYKGMAMACVESETGSLLFQASDPPVVIWSIPEGKATFMTELHGVLYLGCDNGNVFSFSGGSGFLTYVAGKITSMGVMNGSLVVGCAKQGLICFNGTTWERA